MIGKDLIKQKLGKVIRDGKSKKVWQDPWLSLNQPTKPYGPPTEQSKDMMVEELLLLDRRDWCMEKIDTILPELKQ